MDKKNQIGFILRGISTEQFAILEEAYDKTNDAIEMSNSIRFGANLAERIIKVVVSVQFLQKKCPFILLEIACFFEIVEGAWNEMYNDKLSQTNLPKALAAHLVTLSIGTLRGVLHAKLENTPFNSFFLPTINVTEMITEDVIINSTQ